MPDQESIQVGLQLLKGMPEVKAEIEAEVLPFLQALNKRTLRALPTFLKGFQKTSKNPQSRFTC